MATELALTIEWDTLENAQLGPAMLALTKLQQRFVWALSMAGGRNPPDAVRAAGFGTGSANSVRVTAHRLMHDERVNAAIQEVARQRLKHGLMLSTDTLLQIMDGMHGAKASDRLKAIEMVMGRAGLPMISEVHHTTDLTPKSDADLMAEIDGKLAAVGMKLAELIKPSGPIVDAQFSVVEPSSTVGLEDLL